MALYSKKLRNISELEAEKKRLQQKARDLENTDFLPVSGAELISQLNPGNFIKGKTEGNPLLDLVSGASPAAGTVLQIAQNFLTKKSKKEERPQPAQIKTEKKKGKRERSAAESIAWEFIGGYLKWKAIELSYKGIRMLVKKRKEKKKRTTEENYY